MDIEPRGDIVFGRPIPESQEKVSGIIVTKNQTLALENRPIMLVERVGPDVNKPPTDPRLYKPSGREIQVGDVVAYDKDNASRFVGRDLGVCVMVMVHHIHGHVLSDDEGKPEDVLKRKALIDGAVQEQRERERLANGAGIMVPTGAMPKRPVKLVEAAGR